MSLEFVRIYVIDNDPDDEQLSKIRRKFIRRKCVFDMDDVVGFGEHKEFKKCLLIYFNYSTEDDFIIEHDYDLFRDLYNDTRVYLAFEKEKEEDEEEEIPKEFPIKEKIIEIPNINRSTNPDEN